jgi:hypothetical protein
MKDDKKKFIVVVSLALVIVAVGVFQFALQGSPTPPPATATAKKEDPKKPDAAQTVDDIKNKEVALSLPARNPFEQPASILRDAAKPGLPPVTAPTPQPTPARSEPRQDRLPPIRGEINTSSGFAPVTVSVAPEPQFNFRLSGVMLGARPMAVFTDPQGNQRLLLLGGSLDPDSKVTSIDKDAVTIRFHGKTLRLTVEGNPNGK